MVKVNLPPLAEGVNKAVITYLYVANGDTVKEGDKLAELVTDKATFNLPSPGAGRVTQIFFKEGDEVSVGQTIFQIE